MWVFFESFATLNGLSAREQAYRRCLSNEYFCLLCGPASRMSAFSSFLSRFSRITSTSNFIPAIDGLRFVAIVSVIFFHIHVNFLEKAQVGTNIEGLKNLINHFLLNANRGVELFFVISGMILSLPFARHYLKQQKLPSLKDYFIRRLTRLEPPYVLALLMLTVVTVLILKKYTWTGILPHALTSLFYCHNIFYGIEVPPPINPVTWSLEVEVQFYILAPLLCRFFKLSKPLRRGLFLILILLFPLLQVHFSPSFWSLYHFLQYFLVGFLITDFYIEQDYYLPSTSLSIVAGIVSFFLIWSFSSQPNYPDLLNYAILVITVLSIGLWCYLVLFTPVWRNLFSKQVIYTVGGMCYSIYLLHLALIGTVNRVFLNKLLHLPMLWAWVSYAVVCLVTIALIAAIYFITIEKPCMKKEWHLNLWRKLKPSSKG